MGQCGGIDNDPAAPLAAPEGAAHGLPTIPIAVCPGSPSGREGELGGGGAGTPSVLPNKQKGKEWSHRMQ